MRIPLHICFLSDSRIYGGAEHHITLLARGFCGRGHKVTVIMRDEPALSGWEHSLHAIPVATFKEWTNPLGIARWLTEWHPNVLHIDLPCPYSAAFGLPALLAKWTGVSVVVTSEHLPEVVAPRRFRLAKQAFGRWIDAVVTESDANARSLIRLHGIAEDKIARVYFGVDAERFQRPAEKQVPGIRHSLGFSRDDVVVALLGRLNPQKGHIYLLQAAALLKNRYPACKYLFVGDGDQRIALETAARAYGLQDNVVFMGFRNDIPTILQAVDVLVMPSLMEGLPFVLLEAMATGLPVIAFDLACLREVISHGVNGFLVTPQDSEALAVQLDSLLQDRSLWPSIGQKARETVVQRFSLESMIDTTEQLYCTLLQKKSAAPKAI